MIEEKETLIGEINNDVIHVYPELQEKTTSPTTQEQIITPDENVYGLSKVTIGAIPSEYVIPSGTLNINTSGNYDVKTKEYANVILPNKWANIGYETEPKIIDTMYLIAKDIYDNWDASITNATQMFESNKNIIIFPLVDTSNVINTKEMFYGCSNMQEVPLLNMQNCQNMTSMFSGCTSLKNIAELNVTNVTSVSGMFNYCSKMTDESLNNILKMCINLDSYTGQKKLSILGVTSYSSSRIQALPSYQDFINAGWTIN